MDEGAGCGLSTRIPSCGRRDRSRATRRIRRFPSFFKRAAQVPERMHFGVRNMKLDQVATYCFDKTQELAIIKAFDLTDQSWAKDHVVGKARVLKVDGTYW